MKTAAGRTGGRRLEAILQTVLYRNTVQEYLIFAGVLLVSLLAVRVATKILARNLKERAAKSKKPVDLFLSKGAGTYLSPILSFVAIVLCLKLITLSDGLQNVVNVCVKLFFAFVGGLLLPRAVSAVLSQYWRKRRQGETGKMTLHWMNILARVTIWGLLAILLLQNIGVKIDALIAGLGVGGLAIAFAAQVVLEDVFCYFTIFLDRPFEIGDFIVSGEQMGTVEHIGVKTTRLRTLEGEQLILSNKDLTGSRIRNYKTMEQRRVLFTLGVTYQTSAETLAEIPAILRQIVDGVEGASFTRAHFFSFGDSSLNFEVVYYVLSSDYDRYMDVRHRINLQIKAVFDQRGIDFAYPTQTLFVCGVGTPDEAKTAP
jgi:small-conductance mechanosensitive channel